MDYVAEWFRRVCMHTARDHNLPANNCVRVLSGIGDICDSNNSRSLNFG